MLNEVALDKLQVSFDKSKPRPIMKKYYQLALVIISFISVITLMLYRHEYMKLRNVLEVLNFFGKTSSTVNECPFLEVAVGSNLSLSDPPPAWLRISNSHFVYSAFWEGTSQGGQVKAISVGFEEQNGVSFGCHLWFEDKEDPVMGKFSFRIIATRGRTQNAVYSTKNLIAYYLYCKHDYKTDEVPYGTTFYKTDDPVPSNAFLAIHRTQDMTVAANSTALCIAPNRFVSRTSMVEFLSYHQLVGTTAFLVYNSWLPAGVLETLQSPAALGSSLSVVPWNFPFSASHEAGWLAMERDCLMRTRGKLRNVALLSWDEYIVPRYHHQLAAMLDDFDSGRKTTARFFIPTVTFCTELGDDERADASSPLALRKTRYSKDAPLERPFYMYRPLLVSAGRELAMTTQRVSQGIAALHRYTHCSDKQPDRTALYEPAMLRFAGDFKKSKLLLQSNSGKLFQ